MRQGKWRWQPLVRGSRVPLSEEHLGQIRALGGTEELVDDVSAEMWLNAKYVVSVARRPDGSVMELSIRRADRKPVRDWRDFQRIKTQLAGPEVEAFEMYPAESRLMDTANQYYLFCMVPGQQIPAGYIGPRLVRNEAPGNAQQRPLPEDWLWPLSGG